MVKPAQNLRLLSLVAVMALVSLFAPSALAANRFCALVVKSPKASYASTVATLEQALGQANTGTWADHALYNRTAKRLHIRDPFTAKAAQRIGHDVGLSEVLFVTVRTTSNDGESRTFADIELVDVARGAVTVKRSYYLPEKRMSEGTAAYVADFLTMRQGAPEADVAAAEMPAAYTAPSAFTQMHGRDLDDVPAPSATSTPRPSKARKKQQSPMSLLQGLF